MVVLLDGLVLEAVVDGPLAESALAIIVVTLSIH